jgi:hypothetical protein
VTARPRALVESQDDDEPDPLAPSAAVDLARQKKALFDRIEQLGALKDKGLITAEEYEAQKKQILESA